MHLYHRPVGTTPYCYIYGSKAALKHGIFLPATVPLKTSVEDLIQQLDSDLSAVVEASPEFRARYTAEQTLAPLATSSVYPTILMSELNTQEGNAYAVQDLVSKENLSFDVSFLKPFDVSTHAADKLAELLIVSFLVLETRLRRIPLNFVFAGRTLSSPTTGIIRFQRLPPLLSSIQSYVSQQKAGHLSSTLFSCNSCASFFTLVIQLVILLLYFLD
jgi:hypothetical protein